MLELSSSIPLSVAEALKGKGRKREGWDVGWQFSLACVVASYYQSVLDMIDCIE